VARGREFEIHVRVDDGDRAAGLHFQDVKKMLL
jgi:hypothetical protein